MIIKHCNSIGHIEKYCQKKNSDTATANEKLNLSVDNLKKGKVPQHLSEFFKSKTKINNTDDKNIKSNNKTTNKNKNHNDDEKINLLIDDMLKNSNIPNHDQNDNTEYLYNAYEINKKEYKIIIDSGATSHMSPNINSFIDFTPIVGKIVLGNDKYTIKSMGVGSTKFLKNVLYVPSLRDGLISIPKLDKEGYECNFKDDQVKIYDKNKNLAFTGTLKKGLYYLDNAVKNTERVMMLTDDEVKGSGRSRKVYSTANQDKITSLHNRWGHMSINSMKNGIKNDCVIGAGITYEDIKDYQLGVCNACMLGRMNADPTPTSITNHNNDDTLNIICGDIKGPFQKESTHRNKWFILFVCAISSFYVAYFMKSKSESLSKLSYLKQNIRT